MADNMIELVASLNVDDSAKQINTVDIPKLQKKIEGIKIKCELDTEGISSIQSQLANISKNLKIDAPKINADISTENINKKTGSIATVYAEGAKQSEILHLKQERLQQDYDILTAKIQKTKLALDSLATRDGVNYNEIFTGIMSKEIVDEASLNRARDALSAIRKEFQLANAQMTSDIPQNAIENFIQRIAKADSQIKILTVDYQKLNNVPQNLENSFQELQKLVSGFDFSTDFQNESKEGINEKIQAYTKIKVALNETQALLKVAQKEEAAFNKEFERELKIEERINKEKEKTFNKEFEQALKEEQRQLEIEQKRVETARQLREEQQHDYWQGRFEESVKGMTAENQVLKDMKKYYEDLNKAQKEVEKQEKKTFQEDNKLANRQNRIRKLTDDINSYAAANQRATKSNKEMSNGKIFADEWSRIISEMAKGAELTDQEIKQLEADLKSFQKNAKASGEAGASAFERFANSFKVISTYISANQIINRLTSYISSAVNELRNIDDILTEISKTSDITTENLKELGYASYDAASAYGRVASDYLLGVQEFSRAGYDEASAKSMAELSLRAQAAGDMTAEMANQYIIATGAAYQLSDNENELNKVLDSQNYITNHNAINMEQLASATKLVASQAASSGVGIDEMTAAVGTMSATTQQAGEVSGRAFKGILMNLQQVKGAAEDIGDGGEDITEESLSKYEKASEALGVSLKEIKNGTLQLRNPMEVLRDLAKEVEKEGESSLKVANLVAAIGGKYRGNSLIALLRNWDTYEKMLSEFNSTDAVGSAMDEAAKSANNWNGQINKLKNTWTELVNRFVSSDDAIALIGSLNDLITSISDDKNISTLSNLAKTLQSIFVLVSNLSTKIGTLPTLIGGLGFISSLKSSDSILKIFSTVEDKTSSLGRSFTVLGKTGGLSLNSLTTGLTKAKIATVGLQVATAALNAAVTLGLSLAISAVIAGISKLINKEKEAQEQAKKRAEEAKARRKEAVESIKSYDDEATAIQDLVGQYVKIVSSTSDLSVEKEKLLSIQDQIIDKYGAEAEGIDLVNGKLEDNINLLLQSQEEKNKQWQRENYQALEDAEKYFKDRDLTLTNFVVGLDGLDNTGMMDRRARVKAERYVSVMQKAFEEAGVGDLFDFKDYTSKTGANLNGRLMETERTYSVRLKEGLSVEQQKRALEAYEDVYNRILEKQKKYDDVIFSFGGKRHQQLNSIIDTFTGYYDILKQNKEIEESNLSIDQILGNVDDLQKYEDTLSDLTTLSQKINSEDYTPTQKYGFFQQITEGKEAINELIQQYPALRDIAVATLENIGLSADGVVQSETDLFESFY